VGLDVSDPRSWRGRRLLLALAAALAGCAVGPRFKSPAPPAATDYGSASVAGETAAAPGAGGEAQRFIADLNLPAEWWTLFQSVKLDHLVEQALKGNPTVGAAQAALHQARELYAAQRSTLLPSVQGSLDANRSRFAVNSLANPTVSPNPTYTLYTAQLSLSYALDVFGGNRRAIEAAQAQAEVSRFELEAAYLTLSSNVVVTAIQEAGLRGQLAATERLLDLQHQLTDIVRRQEALGSASTLTLLAQQSAQAQTAATLPPLHKQLGQTRDALTALLGRLPADEPPETFRLEDLTLPQELPVSLPSKLVEQRPDVRAAQANLHAASAAVGVALANMLPQFTITADLGSSALKFGDLLRSGGGFWDAGASLTQTLFDAGALMHRQRAAEAALDEAGEQYRAAVILACQNVADALRALRADAEALQASAEASRTAKATLEVASRQVQLGTISVAALASAEQTYQQAELARVQAQANRYADSAGLLQALGGGWWNRPQGESR
jgi:NodT family efflux transporter outer membrane factor (OMF) lipoprotein